MQLSQIVEALLVSSATPLSAKRMAELIRKVSQKHSLEETLKIDRSEVLEAIEKLNEQYQGSAKLIMDRSDGWQLMTRPEFADFIQELKPEKKAKPLNQAAIETLSIIAYKQPTTKANIDSIRGVSSDSAIKKLLALKVIKETTSAELPGAIKLYQTTATFFDYLGISDINELPNLEELQSSDYTTQP